MMTTGIARAILLAREARASTAQHRRVVYEWECLWEAQQLVLPQEGNLDSDNISNNNSNNNNARLPTAPPQALQALGVTTEFWQQDFVQPYRSMALRQGPRWARAQQVFWIFLLSLYGGFILTVLGLYLFASDQELLATVLTIGWFPLYGLTIVTNLVLTTARKRILEQPLQTAVVDVLNRTWRRQRQVPARVEWHAVQTSCLQRKRYFLSFRKHDYSQNHGDDDETVSTDLSA